MSLLPKRGRCFSCGHDYGDGLGDPRMLEASRNYAELLAGKDAEIADLRAALSAKDAPALEAVPVYFARQKAGGNWVETDADHIEYLKARPVGKAFEFRTLYTTPAKQEAAPLAAVPEGLASCSKEEVAAFEQWATDDKYDMTVHPMFWLFLNERTYAARQGWKAALQFARSVLATQQSPAAPTEKESTS